VRPVSAFVAAVAVLLFATPAFAAPNANGAHLHGVVLAVTPGDGQAIVRHDPFAGMPSMSMPFKIAPPSRAGELQPGTVIDATVDTATDPWTLKNLRVETTQSVSPPAPERVPPLKLGDLVPDTPFLDQNGRPFRFSMLRGNDVLLSFIYTRCQDPNMCPLISAKYNQLQHKLGARKLHLVEVTLDPSYDRPPVLARYAKTFGADPRRWTLAVGDAVPTMQFAAQFGITAFPDPNAGIIHSENTVEIDREGRIRNMTPDATWQPDEILADVDALEGAASNPISRLDLWLSRTAVAVCGNVVAGFSGFEDLAILVLALGALTYLVFRLARGLFSPSS
jgi:protein SCO1/2